MPPGSYRTTWAGLEPVGAAVNDPQEAEGSNNWVVGGQRTTTGTPMVASDPHIAFEAVGLALPPCTGSAAVSRAPAFLC